MPTGTPVARRTRSVTTDRKAGVSGPISSGFEKGMSPWFSTISPCMPARDQCLGVAEAGVIEARPSPRRDSGASPGKGGQWIIPIRTLSRPKISPIAPELRLEISLHRRTFQSGEGDAMRAYRDRQRGAGRGRCRWRTCPLFGASIHGRAGASIWAARARTRRSCWAARGLPLPLLCRRSGDDSRADDIRSRAGRGSRSRRTLSRIAGVRSDISIILTTPVGRERDHHDQRGGVGADCPKPACATLAGCSARRSAGPAGQPVVRKPRRRASAGPAGGGCRRRSTRRRCAPSSVISGRWWTSPS